MTARLQAASWPKGINPTGLVGLAALVLYVASVRPYPMPGMSASVLVQHLWLDGSAVPGHFLWGLISRLLAFLAPSHVVLVLNLFSALCGAVAVWLLSVASLWILEAVSPLRQSRVRIACAAGAGLYFAVSPSMWLVSTRAHPLSFDAMLLLGALVLLLDYQWRARPSRLYSFLFLFGVGFMEYAGFVILAVPLAAWAAFLMVRHRHTDVHHALNAAVWAGLGLTVSQFGVWALLHSPAAVWTDNMEPIRVFRSMLGAQLLEIRRATAGTGWMIGALIGFPPWIVCLIQTRSRGATHRHVPSALLYAVVTLVLIGAAFPTPLAPWYHFGERFLTLLPYVWLSSTFALVLNYWLGLLETREGDARRPVFVFRLSLASLLALCIVASSFTSYRAIRATHAGSLYACAEHMIEAVAPRSWIVTDGSLDNLLRVAAKERGRDVVVWSIPENTQKRNRRALAAQFESPRLRGLAKVGLLPLVRELIRTDPDVAEKLAIQNTGSLWVEGGFGALPDRMAYVGVHGDSTVDLDAQARVQASYWQEIVPGLVRTESRDPRLAPLARYVLVQISRAANELGVYMQQSDRDDLAEAAYLAAREADEENLSALVNLQALAGGPGDAAVDALGGDLGLSAWDVVFRHGSIHDPSVLTNMVPVQSPSGVPVSAALREDLNRVGEMYREGDKEAGLQALNDLAKEYADHPLVWYLRGALAAEVGDEKVWEACWEYMSGRGIEWPAFLLIQARRMEVADRMPEALGLYDRAVERNPIHPAVLSAASQAALKVGDMDRLERLVERILSLNPADPWGNYALGAMQLERGELDLAESSFRVAMLQSDNPLAANNLAWLLVLREEYEEALEMADRAIEIDDTFASAWDTRAVALLRLERVAEAMDSLDRALALTPESWDARLHQSMVLVALHRPDEALTILQELEPDARKKSESQFLEYDAFRQQMGLPPIRR